MNPLSWERRTPKEVLAHWKTSETTGLSEKEAAKRRSTYGTNELAHKKPESHVCFLLKSNERFHDHYAAYRRIDLFFGFVSARADRSR